MNSMEILRSWQSIILRVDYYFHQNFYQQIYDRCGVFSYFTVRINGKELNDERLEAFLKHLIHLLSTAEEIKIVLGELGKRFIDDPRIIAALREAYERSRKPVELIHGPYIHPETQLIFSLAKEGIVQIYQMPRYVPHHFVLMRDKLGAIHIADENPHNETLWAIHDGKIEQEFRSIYREWYIVTNSQRYYKKLYNIFEQRKHSSILTVERPPSVNAYKFKFIRMTTMALRNMYERYITQPMDLILDKSLTKQRELQGKILRQATLTVAFVIGCWIGINRITKQLPDVDSIKANVIWVNVKPMLKEQERHSKIPKIDSSREISSSPQYVSPSTETGVGSYKVDWIEDIEVSEGTWQDIHVKFDPNDISIQKRVDQMIVDYLSSLKRRTFLGSVE